MLASKRPSEIPRAQWEYVVGWTLELHANCASDFTQISLEDKEKFARELEIRLNGEIDLATIDWIWDEYSRFARTGQTYSDKYRPTLPERLKEAELGCFGIPVN